MKMEELTINNTIDSNTLNELNATAEALANINNDINSDDLPKALSSVIPRRGIWSLEEERYAEKIICNFENGTLDVPKNTTLRMYLARVLNCDPMRISKKYNGNWRVRRRYFAPLTSPGNEALIQTSRSELDELRRVFVNKLRLLEKRDDRKRNWNYDKPNGEIKDGDSSAGNASKRVPGPKDRSRYGLEDTLTKQFFIVKQAIMASPDELIQWNHYFEGLSKRLPKKTPFSATAKAVAKQVTTEISTAGIPLVTQPSVAAIEVTAVDNPDSSDSEAEDNPAVIETIKPKRRTETTELVSKRARN